MKCEDVQKRIDLELTGSSLDFDSALKSHIESCEKCGLYYKEVIRLKGILSSQSFEVLPGELDDITFEKIIHSAKPESRGAGVFESIFSLRWVWAPAAAVAIIILFLVSPDINNLENGKSLSVQSDSTYLGNGIFVESDEEASALAVSLISDNAEIELLADELIFGSEIDDLIETLTDDEFEILYERLGNTNGSS
ncbi:MAG: hypothetical protein JSU85_08335 [Candidatus Zixiibacteriota bacterium]|nr:MAG: hypothetical protein JSU85_08335 [candidate division Zixibacteria bacterium]